MDRLSLLEAPATVPDPRRPKGRRGRQLRERRFLAGAARGGEQDRHDEGQRAGRGARLRGGAAAGYFFTRFHVIILLPPSEKPLGRSPFGPTDW